MTHHPSSSSAFWSFSRQAHAITVANTASSHQPSRIGIKAASYASLIGSTTSFFDRTREARFCSLVRIEIPALYCRFKTKDGMLGDDRWHPSKTMNQTQQNTLQHEIVERTLLSSAAAFAGENVTRENRNKMHPEHFNTKTHTYLWKNAISAHSWKNTEWWCDFMVFLYHFMFT